jgi:hypothetical protein
MSPSSVIQERFASGIMEGGNLLEDIQTAEEMSGERVRKRNLVIYIWLQVL